MSKPPIVQGYVYSNDFDESGYSGKVCKILRRAQPDPFLDLMPKFVVEFGDGQQAELLGEHLQPWYPS